MRSSSNRDRDRDSNCGNNLLVMLLSCTLDAQLHKRLSHRGVITEKRCLLQRIAG